MQFKLANNFEVLLEGIYSKLKTERAQDFLNWRYSGTAITNPVFDGNFIVAGNASGVMQQAGLFRAEPTESKLAAISTKWTPGNFLVTTDLSASRGTIDQVIRQITIDTATAIPGRFDYRAGVIPSLDLGTFDVTNFANYRPATNGVRSNRLLASMDEAVAQARCSIQDRPGFPVQCFRGPAIPQPRVQVRGFPQPEDTDARPGGALSGDHPRALFSPASASRFRGPS